MKMMTRNVLIGVGVAAAIGTAFALTSDSTLEKIENMMNRKKAKMFVNEKLHGNEKAMNVVNNLSDEEIRNLLQVVDKVTDLRGHVTDYSDQLKDATMEFKDMLADKKEDAMEAAADMHK